MKKNFYFLAVAFLFSGMISAQSIDINKIPKAGVTPSVNIAKPKTFQLKNGLTVMVMENHKLPKVSINLTMDRPPVLEGNVAGVSTIMAQQLGNGTQKTKKDEFNKKVDFLGAKLNFGSANASASTLSKYFGEVLDLFSEAVLYPSFTEDEISKSKSRMLEGLKADEKNATSISDRVRNALLFGKNSARGEFYTSESVENIKASDVDDFYKKNFGPENSYLVIVGDVKFSEVKNKVTKAFTNWKKTGTKYPALAQAPAINKTQIDVVDLPSAVQSVITVTNHTNILTKDSNYFPASLANYILGGGSDSRLYMNLRESKGFTYGAYSSLSSRKENQTLVADASVRNEVSDKAIAEFINEYKGISTIKPEELALAKEKYKGNFIMSLERPETLARYAVAIKTQNLPQDFYTNYLKSVDNVTLESVSAAAKEIVKPENARILVVGKGSEISQGIEKLGYPVHYYDAYANPIAKPLIRKMDTSVTIQSITDAYFKAIGGKEAAEKINSIKFYANASIGPNLIGLESVEGKGGKNRKEIKIQGNLLQRIVFDGNEGYIETSGNKSSLNDVVKKEMKGTKEVFPEFTIAKDSSYKLKGIENYNNEECYLIENESGKYYYSVATGLKVGEVKTMQGVVVPVTFSDYREVDAVKLPFKFSQSAMGTELNFEIEYYELNKAKDSDFK